MKALTADLKQGICRSENSEQKRAAAHQRENQSAEAGGEKNPGCLAGVEEVGVGKISRRRAESDTTKAEHAAASRRIRWKVEQHAADQYRERGAKRACIRSKVRPEGSSEAIALDLRGTQRATHEERNSAGGAGRKSIAQKAVEEPLNI